MRKVGSIGEETERLIRKAAIDLISKHGFEAMTLRQLAHNIDLQQGSLYNHIENKQDLLFDLMRRVMKDLLAAFDQRVASIDDPTEALDAFVTLHIEFHTERKNEVFLATTELRSLEPENHRKIVKCGTSTRRVW